MTDCGTIMADFFFSQESKPIPEANGHLPEASHDITLKKLPVSFAAIATTAPDTAKEVTVSA